MGGFERWGWWVLILSIGVLISAAYAVRTIGHLFTGPVRQPMQGIADLQRGELMAASVLTLGFLLIGFVPAPLLQLMGASVVHLSSRFIGGGG
jgi:NADH-quinone oxidoreductase subunit M